MLVWDNLNTHISAAMRQMIAGRDWLTVIRLPAYAPDLNPTEGVWSHLKRSIGNLAVTGLDHDELWELPAGTWFIVRRERQHPDCTGTSGLGERAGRIPTPRPRPTQPLLRGLFGTSFV